MTIIPNIEEEKSSFEKLKNYIDNSFRIFERKQKEDFKRLQEQLDEISRDIEDFKQWLQAEGEQ